MILLLAAVVVGFGVGLLTSVTVPAPFLDYLAVMVLAGLDACLGGVRAALEQTFSDRRFVAGFGFNLLIAGFIVFLGDSVGLQELYLAAAVPFVLRMVANLAAIRDLWFERRGWE
jgi:small basic protein